MLLRASMASSAASVLLRCSGPVRCPLGAAAASFASAGAAMPLCSSSPASPHGSRPLAAAPAARASLPSLLLRRCSAPAGLAASQGAAWATVACAAQRWRSSSGPGYGTVPSDIDAPRGAAKPTEEDLRREERRRTHGHATTAEEANQEAVSTHVSGYNPWEVLGLKSGASTHTIRLRYHELMKQVHPDMAADGAGDIPRLNQINKAYELITKSPTLDRRYRNLVSDTQHFYYRFLPEWMARNVDEMPRYWSWVKWRTPSGFHIFLLLCGFYVLGRFYAAFPMLTSVFFLSVGLDVLLHTMLAPAALCMLFLYSIMAYRSYDMAWLTSPKGFLRRELGY